MFCDSSPSRSESLFLESYLIEKPLAKCLHVSWFQRLKRDSGKLGATQRWLRWQRRATAWMLPLLLSLLNLMMTRTRMWMRQESRNQSLLGLCPMKENAYVTYCSQTVALLCLKYFLFTYGWVELNRCSLSQQSESPIWSLPPHPIIAKSQ